MTTHASVGSALVAVLAFTLLVPGRAAAQPFTLATPPAIAAHVAFSLGATWVDADHDGDLDLYVVTGFSANNGNVYYRNDGAGAFTNVTGVPITQDFAETACSSWADYDNDGDVDAFVSNLVDDGGMLFDGQSGADLVANPGAGLGGAAQMGTGCAWGDYDNDGRLDLVIAALAPTVPTPCRLFHNQGGGTFAEVIAGALGSTVDTHHHPTWSDYDGDGDLDLFFATGPVGSRDLDRMYRNQLKETGAATFVPIATGVFATETRDSQGLTWVDYDNDGDLDLYAINYTSVPNQLYRNDGGGTFTKITTGAIVTDAGAAHGVAWGDFDLDGDLDVYVARDNHQQNRFYQNHGDGSFTSVTTGAFVTDAVSNYSAVAGDYDGDGDLDLFAPTARSEGASRLYRNDVANGNHWLAVRGVGFSSNRSAVGAKVRVRAVIGGAARWQMREILASGGYGGHSPLEAHFGLGDAVVADSVRVEWPSGVVDLLVRVPADQRVVLPEASTTGVSEAAPTGARLVCLPNPIRGPATLRFRLARPERIVLTLHDSAGRRIATLAAGERGAGEHQVALGEKWMARPGIYWANLRTGGPRHSPVSQGAVKIVVPGR